MKYYRGFSTIELILFLCIAGILLFLAIPFLRSLSSTSTKGTYDTTSASPFISEDSNFSSRSKKIPDTNQSTDLPAPD